MGKLTNTVVLNYILFLQFSLSGLFLCKCLDLWIRCSTDSYLLWPSPYTVIPFAVYEKR